MTRAPVASAVVLAIAALSLGACATSQPYGPASGATTQGYSEQRVEVDRYRITYRGVGDPMRTSDLALLRAAELTLQQGYDWFEVTQRWIDGRPSGGVRPSVSVGAGSSRYGGYRSSGVGVGLGLTFEGQQPTSTVLEVRLGRGSAPDAPDAYDARQVETALRSRP